ncbi:MAG: HlyC/CorC family transporter [Bacteroidales bacterium]|nr:HlyC/CorC family transporter [Bacteroidales bacterium]
MNNWLTILITLLFSAFFSGMEIAFISSNKLKIELDKKKGSLSAKILSKLNNKPSKVIGTLLIGNNIALVIYGIVMANILEPIIINFMPLCITSDFSVLLLQTIISTLLILIAAEFIPKILFSINPNSLISVLAIPLKIFYIILFPIVSLFLFISKFIFNTIFRLKFTEEKYSFSFIDLNNYINESKLNIDTSNIKQEIQIFQNVIDFRNIKIRECMIPRTEIVALKENDSIENLKQKFTETGFSKIIIYKNSIDNIIGYAHAFDMFSNPKSIKSILKPIIIFPEAMHANAVLSAFIKQNKNIAVVVDEFGGTSGMLTMEDVIEEIFGEINDEYDTEDLIEKQINNNEFIFSGRTEIDYLNEKYNFNLPESEDYETIAGFIIHIYENIPKNNQKIFFQNFTFIILSAGKTKIHKVKMIINSNSK